MISSHPQTLENIAAPQAIVSIPLSSRGWGDFGEVEWVGDVNTPIERIIKECQKLLKSEHDVDFANQSDSDIKIKVSAAVKRHLSEYHKDIKSYNEFNTLILTTPESIKQAYADCHGNPEKLPNNIDHPHYHGVARYAHALQSKAVFEIKYKLDC